MKLAPAWDQVLSWAATCRERARASHDFTCEVSGAEAPYVWDRDGPAVKLMAQFARPMVAGTGSCLGHMIDMISPAGCRGRDKGW